MMATAQSATITYQGLRSRNIDQAARQTYAVIGLPANVMHKVVVPISAGIAFALKAEFLPLSGNLLPNYLVGLQLRDFH